METSPISPLGMTAAKIAAVLLTLGAGTSCGSTLGEDVFYVHVVNGYAGGGAMTIYSSTGPLVEGLTFGESAGPIAIDRTRFAGEIQISMEGVSQLATVAVDSFAFYPDETVTLFVKRRSGDATFELQVMRHHLLTQGAQGQGQTAPPYACVAEFYNGLSIANTYTDGRFTFQTQWDFSNNAFVAAGIYDANQETLVPTECGPLNLNALATGAAIVQSRNDQLLSITNDPWLYLVDDPDTNYLTWRWGAWDGVSGNTIRGTRSSREYLECLSQAITIEQQLGPMGAPESDNPCAVDSLGNVSIPLDENNLPSVTIDQEAVTTCFEPENYSGRAIQPGTEQSTVVYYRPLNGAANCNFRFRARTRAVDSIFDAPPMDTSRQGPYVAVDVKFPLYTWQHVMLYGKPINPFSYQITSAAQAQTYSDITDYPDGATAPTGVRVQNEGGQATAGAPATP